ncbi:MAG: hypothetical protein HFH67_11525 [Lachnospiraceae bacterium]|nr:hypothetical protein [Lachnospiraceae bacterium]MDE7051314.1 hypothetical protein [Lachnospiraceae bacterium]
MLIQHVTDGQLKDYISGKMPYEGQIELMEHISGCVYCAGKLAGAMQKQELVDTPPGLKESILKQTVLNKKKRRKNEFWIFTAKVSFAVSVAVVVIMTTALPGNIQIYKDRGFSLTKEIKAEDRKSNSRILDLFRDTSSKISDDVYKALNID